MPYWQSGYTGSLELEISLEDAECGFHQGDCADDVDGLRRQTDIARQVDAWPADALRRELAEYGAWNDDELADDAENRARMLWLACGDIVAEAVETRAHEPHCPAVDGFGCRCGD
jgi:hypothetical protein